MTEKRDRRTREAADAAAKLGTRAQLLDAAGELFAERGFDGVTGREICARAGANAAAINYHFGGMEGLYTAVLEAARERFISQDEVMAALSADGGLEGKLTALARMTLKALLGESRSGWGLRLITRELTSPSTGGVPLLVATAKPRIAVFRSIVGAVTGLPEDHPAVSRCCLTIAAPLQFLMIADREVLKQLYPDLDLSPAGVDVLVEHLVRYASAGLAAVAEAERKG